MMDPFNRYLLRLSLPLIIAILLAVFLLYGHAHDLWVRSFSHKFRSSLAPRLTRWADEVRFAELLNQLQLSELGESPHAARLLCDVSPELVELWVALHTQVGSHEPVARLPVHARRDFRIRAASSSRLLV